MAKSSENKKEKIISAISLWRTFDVSEPLETALLEETKDEKRVDSALFFYGRGAADGRVRVYARFARPATAGKVPAVLLLGETGKPIDEELIDYYLGKGYAVLAPDYSGEYDGADDERRTVYPPSLSYANYAEAQGMYDLAGRNADETCWYEWTYVALYAVEYLRSREDVSGVGVVGIRSGGEVAWKVMLSPHVNCGVVVNAAGWLSLRGTKKFAENSAVNLKNERHRYIAGVESQSYAPFVKKPVLMLCALEDGGFDADRAYDTFSRIGGDDFNGENAICYSSDSGSCIGADGLTDMDLFMQKHLKGREIYIPDALNISVTEQGGKLTATALGDEEGLVEEMGVFYAEADVETSSVFREWLCVHKTRAVKGGKTECTVTPFAGAKAVFFYAYARYINGFVTVSKIVAKKFENCNPNATKSRILYGGGDIDCFSVANHEDYSIGGIFLEKEALPKLLKGYGGITGAYSLGGIKTHKISSPRYIPDDGAMLSFHVYSKRTTKIQASVDIETENAETLRYTCNFAVQGGGKWKHVVLTANDFKIDGFGSPLKGFSLGNALIFDCQDEENEYAVTNIVWL